MDPETKSEISSNKVGSTERTVWAIRFTWRGKEWSIGMHTDRAPLEGVMLSKGGSRWRSFCASAVVQFTLLLAVLMVSLLFPDQLALVRRYVATEIAPTSPIVSAWQPRRPRRTRMVRVPIQTNPELTRPVLPSPVASAPVVKSVRAVVTPSAPKLAVEPSVPVSVATSTVPQLQRPREPVRIGGFGDPDGIQGEQTSARPNVAKLGDFDLPTGPSGSRGHGRLGVVREGEFGNEQSPESDGRRTKTVEVAARSKPLDILFKPTPKYTREARSKRIQGDVLLQVLFPTTGPVKVLRLIRGLGFGLDQSAEEAAREIRFRPAENEAGRPIDSTADVHIVFELAY